MSLCCVVCHEPEGDDAVVIEVEEATFQSVCMVCIQKLDKERVRRQHNRFAHASYVNKPQPAMERGFVTIRFSTEYTDYV